MNNLKDKTNKRFGKLIAISYIKPVEKGKHGKWLCKCDCGNITEVYTNNLSPKYNRSCGCSRGYESLTESSLNKLIRSYKERAIKKGLIFSLTLEEFYLLTSDNCYYCKSAPNQKHKTTSGRLAYTYNGIDRINNTKGYTIDNVRTCCKYCNTAKMEMTEQQFLDLIGKIYINLLNH